MYPELMIKDLLCCPVAQMTETSVLRIILWILTTEGTETQRFKEQSVSLRRLTLAY